MIKKTNSNPSYNVYFYDEKVKGQKYIIETFCYKLLLPFKRLLAIIT